MKEVGTIHWMSPPNTGADNNSGFTALPGGGRDPLGIFYYIGVHGYWWSATESEEYYASYLGLFYNRSDTDFIDDQQRIGFSVRCVKN